MRPRFAALLLLLAGCDPEPAELNVSLLEPATADAQYFHGNCPAGFSVRVEIRVQERGRVGLVLSRLSYRATDRGTGGLVADESLDARVIDERYGDGASEIPAGGTRIFSVGGVSETPVGPIIVTGEIKGVDENGERIATSFDLMAPLVVNDPGPPAGGACTP